MAPSVQAVAFDSDLRSAPVWDGDEFVATARELLELVPWKDQALRQRGELVAVQADLLEECCHSRAGSIECCETSSRDFEREVIRLPGVVTWVSHMHL